MSHAALRKLAAGLAIAATSLLIAFLLSLAPLLKTFEWKIYDLEFRQFGNHPDRANPGIVMVKIDDLSIQRIAESGFGRFPWKRDTYEILLKFFRRAPPKVVTFDIVFLEEDKAVPDANTPDSVFAAANESGRESDQQFVDATKDLGRVVNAVEINDSAKVVPETSLLSELPSYRLGTEIEEHASVKLPFARLTRASRMTGHTFIVLDSDGPARRAVPFVRQGNTFYPSLALATAMLALDVQPTDIHMESDGLHFGSRVVPLLDVEQEYIEKIRARHILIPYKGSAYTDTARNVTTYRSYRFWDLFVSELKLREGQKPDVDPSEFKDKIVFIGSTAAGTHDLFQTPYGDEGIMPGMQIHASVVDGILSDSYIRPGRWTSAALLPVVSTIVVALFGVFAGFWWSLLVAAGAIMADAGIVASSFQHGVWLRSVPTALGLGLAQVSSIAYKYFIEGRDKRRVHALFSRFVPPAVVQELVKDPERARLGGRRREMTVLFSDIRGFTTLSEAGRPEDVIAQLNEYFTRMVEILFQHHGTLDKFVGDMIMALFNAPLEDPDHADHAVQMGLAMLKGLEELNKKWESEGKMGFDIGIGINTGAMIVGFVGSEETLSHTVIGDNVNLGSRLESLNKEYNTHIIISEATYRKLKGRYNVRPLGSVTVKGKTQEVAIYEVCI